MNEQGSTAARGVAQRVAITPGSSILPRARGTLVALVVAAMLPAALASGLERDMRGGATAVEPVTVARRLDGRPMSLDEAVDAAQRRYNARVVRAEVEERGGRRVYVLRLLSSDGRVFNVRVDAASGRMQ